VLEGINVVEKSSHQRDACFHAIKPTNNYKAYGNRLLTNEKLLKLKAKQKKRQKLFKPKKIKRKHKSYKSPIDYRLQLRKDISVETALNGQKETATLDETTKSKLSKPTAIDKRLVWIMAAACGLSVANLIYAQPLLASMGRSFAISSDQVGLVATLSQLGYAAGLILIAPLGEKYNQRTLVVVMLCVLTIALIGMALAPTVAILTIASVVIGLTSVLPELLIPFAAKLASSNERGHIVGTMGSAILVGTLLANLLSGIVGEHLGWRAMYGIAAAMIITLVVVLYIVLPADHSAKSKVSYPKLLGSLWTLLVSEPVLQEISVIVILVFTSFNAFWVTLSFLLETPPYHYGSDIVGLFGLVGLTGTLAASFVGRFADRYDARYANGAALPVALLSFVIMWLTSQWFIGLIIGAVLLDLGTQSSQVANETRIYTLDPTAWNRLNTVYIFMFSIGTSLGCVIGTFAWSIAKWNGVCSTACLLLTVALGFYVLHSKRIRQWKQSQGQEQPIPIALPAGA
jgi:predicted MFS family arabinose efflux permease